MADLGVYFTPALGKASPTSRDGIGSKLPLIPGKDWKYVTRNSPGIRPGYYRDRFYNLFSSSVGGYQRCVEAWSFMLPDKKDRVVIGANAYGALLLVELNANEAGQVGVLDTIRPAFETQVGWSFFPTLFSQLLPQKLLGTFCDESVYSAWRKQEKKELGPNEILGIRIPRGLGGKLVLSNFEREDIFSHYESRADIYKRKGAPKKK